ncbi:MAG TPA: recombinase family protein [Gemmatimonadaceae bacterium]|nr:recombinase family protein [Gemmatimonadaceae bacterium]
MSVYGYIRVSTLEQVEGGSLKHQDRQVRSASNFIGEDIAEVFEDGGVSGCTSLFDRPGAKRMVDTVKEGDTIIAAKLDRMFRSAQEALEWLGYFKKHGVKLVLCDLGLDPVTDNGVSKLMFSILASMAEFERMRIKERSAEGRAIKSMTGGWLGGRPPFGYMIEGTGKAARCVPDPAHADALAQLKRCWENDVSLRKAADTVSKLYGVRVSFNQVGRVYEKFNHDYADQIQRHNTGASA